MAGEEEGKETSNVDAAFLKLCKQLDLGDEETKRAWASFSSVESQCSLEGPRERWWVCAIYLASRAAAAEADEEGEERPVVNLARLVKASGLSVLGMLEQLGKWGEMGGGATGGSSRKTAEAIARVQAVFAASAVLFRKFLAAFRVVFAVEKVGGGTGKRVARGKRNEAASLVHFLWTLFIAAKTKLPQNQAEDVLTCFHLLLCVFDYARRDLIEQGQTHLLNADFVDPKEEDEDGSIVHLLCERFQGSVLDAKHFHVHWWQSKVESFVVDGLIPTAAESGILNAADAYRKALEGVYEEAMLKRGEMDERIFIPSDVALLLTPAAQDNPMLALEQGKKSDTSDTQLLLRMSLQSCMEKISQFRLPTPLSGRSYVIAGDQFCPATPISAAQAAASRLAALTSDVTRHLRPALLALFPASSAGTKPNPPQLIADVLGQSAAAFLDAFTDDAKGDKLRDEAEALYFRLLDRLVASERERGHNYKPNSGLCQEALHRSLIAVSYELVLFSHGETAQGKENTPSSSREFPWILAIVGVPPLQFYKIIELVIRAEPGLSRDMVKHLNMAEERVLEELGWSAKSALWDILAAGTEVPACADVAHPSHLPSTGPESAAKRKLTFPSATAAVTISASSEDGGPAKIRAVGLGPKPSPAPLPTRSSSNYQAGNSPSGALELFFRKAYYLASVRLVDLADRLAVPDKARQAAWTLLEHALRSHTDLLKDRHLDQALMCSLYVVARLAHLDVSFHDIMSQYRHQPQAHSRIYRKVLLEGEDEYGDLIQFYNKIFIGRVEGWAKRLPLGQDSKDAVQQGLPLSPLPSVKAGAAGLSPRRKVADGVYVSPLALPNLPASPARPLRYSFNRSPYKDLKAINSMIRAGVGATRRWPVSDSLGARRIHLPSNL